MHHLKNFTNTHYQQVAVPEGWQLVPKILTREMAEAFNACNYHGAGPHWGSMLSATPKPEVQWVAVPEGYVPVPGGLAGCPFDKPR